VILRQNKAIHYEAPFLFLLFGERRAVLLDTGATAEPELLPLRRVVDDLVEEWLRKHPRDSYGLLVLHTHGHGDHVAADEQFADRPDTELVPADLEHVQAFFGFEDNAATVDLGDRVLDALFTPGHEPAAVTFFDPATGWLLTGDTVYPGRLYVRHWAQFVDSIDRMVVFAEARPVTHVLGCHIEMTGEPGIDYPVRTTYQPDEPPLELPVSVLRDVQSALREIDGEVGSHPYDRFVISVVG
jgi:glyoxylase-like metal-dependent hydrolase (beta-lactamase superfamily II)